MIAQAVVVNIARIVGYPLPTILLSFFQHTMRGWARGPLRMVAAQTPPVE